MPHRQTLPVDDLYARLELPADASLEAIEIAWRGLLRLHHPDIAGPDGLERAKRINVAHDWLSDPGLRARYDRERGLASKRLRPEHRGRGWADDPDDGEARRDPRSAARRPIDPAEAIARFLERVSWLSVDELDRLAVADPAPIAFGATIQRFLPLDLRAALRLVEREIDKRLRPGIVGRSGIRDVIEVYAAELVLGSFLDDLLSEPFRARTRERLTRGWDAAVGQPRYGPNGPAIEALLGRLRAIREKDVARLAASGTRERLGDEPWPPGVSADDDEALRVSSLLAARDAADAVPGIAADPGAMVRARRAAARIGHLLVLRHAFAPAAFMALTTAWRPGFVPDDRPAARVRRPI